MNYEFLKPLKLADELLLTGEARSHCLANTGRDIVTGFGDDKLAAKLTLLEGSTSDVPGFEFMGEDFVKDLTALGMKSGGQYHVDTYLR
jgi:nicotinamidase-related amidase